MAANERRATRRIGARVIGAGRVAASLTLILLFLPSPAPAVELADFRSPLGWDGRLIQPDGLYAVTVPQSWTVTPIDQTSFHAEAPGESSFFLYAKVAKKRFETLDGALDALMELPKREMKGFREISRKPFTQDGRPGKTLQAEENDGAWNKVFYMVMFTDTHQYLIRMGCRLDRFAAVQPIMKMMMESLYVGPRGQWKRKNTHAIEDPGGRYSAHVPPGWTAERRSEGMRAESATGTSTFSVTVRDRRHRSLQEYATALSRALKERYPDLRPGSPMNVPELAASNQAAKIIMVATGGPADDKRARVYGIALSDTSEFLLEGVVTGLKGGAPTNGATDMGRLVGLWHAHLRPE